MFAVVRFDQEPKGLFKKLFWRFSKREVNAEKVSVAPGVFFFSSGAILHLNMQTGI